MEVSKLELSATVLLLVSNGPSLSLFLHRIYFFLNPF